MPVSKNGMFKVSVLNSKVQRAFTELITPEKKCYICVENNQPFKISLFVDEQYIDDSYGCHLYLDGKSVRGKKTIKGKGCYHGFKQGGGRFKEFLFSIPPQGEEEHKEELEVDESFETDRFGKRIYKRLDYIGPEYFGTVHIRFFNCREGELKPAGVMRSISHDAFQQSLRKGDVKVAYQSMSVKEGDTFEVKSGPFKRRRTDQDNSGWGNDEKQSTDGWGGADKENAEEEEPKMFKEYLILEREGPIDEVTIHYGDIAALQILGILSLDNYKHLSMIPPPLLAEATYVIKVFKTIIQAKKKIYMSDCSSEFEEATTCRLSDLFLNVEEELPEFFKIKSDIFCLGEDGSITLNRDYKEMIEPARRPKEARIQKKAIKPSQASEVIEID
ncbi:unnamed protein product [Moneuplotes crassus]|uniref:Uncharacterized protein n=1 Tax=Euplotes crassus TaxID=5936 RepID=A0AAD1UF88_EUPCR|nr:unnamed protein product [Moneuplotes crassus]